MHSVFIVLLGIAGMCFGWFVYSRFVASRIFRLDPHFVTPAHEFNDGVDFVPTNRYVLWGHHFTSVAGAAPIVGPAIAVYWGWAPAVAWVVLGTIFFAGVHDFGALWASNRHKARSIGALSEDVVGARTRKLYMVVVFSVVVDGQLGVRRDHRARLCGYAKCRVPGLGGHPGRAGNRATRASQVQPDRALSWRRGGAVLFHIRGRPHAAGTARDVRSGAASQLGLDSISLCRGGLHAGRCGFCCNRAISSMEYNFSWAWRFSMARCFWSCRISPRPPSMIGSGESAPSIVPLLFVTIACGAVSGFHGIVASGTSSKQLDKEPDARFVGYLGAVGEGSLALITIVAVTGVTLAATTEEWHAMYGEFGQAGAASFIQGAANLISSGWGIPRGVAETLLATMVVLFAGTTMDSGGAAAALHHSGVGHDLSHSGAGQQRAGDRFGGWRLSAVGIWCGWNLRYGWIGSMAAVWLDQSDPGGANAAGHHGDAGEAATAGLVHPGADGVLCLPCRWPPAW